MCTGNTVQPIADYGTSCPTTCDGLTKIPNSGHTACGKSSDALTTSNDEICLSELHLYLHYIVIF